LATGVDFFELGKTMLVYAGAEPTTSKLTTTTSAL
jgi:hypothetical protein